MANAYGKRSAAKGMLRVFRSALVLRFCSAHGEPRCSHRDSDRWADRPNVFHRTYPLQDEMKDARLNECQKIQLK
jgi:hypothetical protein